MFWYCSFLLARLLLIFSCLCDTLLSKPSHPLCFACERTIANPTGRLFLFYRGLQFEALSLQLLCPTVSLNHVVKGRFVFLLLISSLPVSLTFSRSFASLCLPIPTTSTSCSVYTLWEKLFQSANSLAGALQVPLEQGLLFLRPKLWTRWQCFCVFNVNPLAILNTLKSQQKAAE